MMEGDIPIRNMIMNSYGVDRDDVSLKVILLMVYKTIDEAVTVKEEEKDAEIGELHKVNDMLIKLKRGLEEQIDSLQAELEGREQGCYGKACSHYVLAKEYKQERDEAHAKLAHLERKLAHGCIDAYCPQCDGKE